MLYLRSWAYFYLFLPFLSLLLNFDDSAVPAFLRNSLSMPKYAREAASGRFSVLPISIHKFIEIVHPSASGVSYRISHQNFFIKINREPFMAFPIHKDQNAPR